jgi:cyclopropane-fatty-acyl-phospholipid synthase
MTARTTTPLVSAPLVSTRGETGLPRYFQAVFDQASRMEHGRLDMVLPDGRVFRAEGPKPGPVAELHIHNTDIFARLIREGDLGFCEAYLDEWWSTPDLQAFMDLVHADNEEVYDGFLGMRLVRAYEMLRFWLQSNSRRQAKKNISYHYDLGNQFYGLWLDDTMTYSSAKFETGQESLEAAQTLKYASMVDQMGAQPGDHVLEIGCGWGGFAEYAAKERGLRVTGLTISKEQHDYAVARMARQGLSDRVEIKLQDYRDERGTYDGIASIEMFEAVGEKYWPVYFDTLRERLKPGRQATCRSSRCRTGAGRSTSAASISSRNTSSRAACCPRRRCCAKRCAARGWRSRAPSSSGKAIPRRCGAGTRVSTPAGTRWRSSASTTGSAGCGISTCVPARRPSASG